MCHFTDSNWVKPFYLKMVPLFLLIFFTTLDVADELINVFK